MPFGFLKRQKAGGASGASAAGGPSAADPAHLHTGHVRGVAFTALTEDWRLHGGMEISGRLSDALNKRDAIAITDVTWGPPGSTALEPAPGLWSVDPYDLILVTAGEDSLPPLTDTERAALKVHKVAYDVMKPEQETSHSGDAARISGSHVVSDSDELLDDSWDQPTSSDSVA